MNVPSGQDPLNQCTDAGVATCGTDGSCDGGGACRLYAAGTTVRGGDVHGLDGHARAHVQRHRHLPGGHVVQLHAVQSAARGACRTTCTVDGDCVAPNICSGGVCTKRPNGATCTADGDCANNVCAQGVCCASVCTATCRSCALAGTPGDVHQRGGRAGSAEPVHRRRRCQLRQRRHLQRRRRLPAVRAPARSAWRRRAPARRPRPRARATAAGTCQTVSTSSCNPYACGTGACRTSCTSNADCNVAQRLPRQHLRAEPEPEGPVPRVRHQRRPIRRSSRTSRCCQHRHHRRGSCRR